VDDPDAKDEIWSYGLRNPWRFSFDSGTGDLLIGDVGQSDWEEIDWASADSEGGENYGWASMEGTHPFRGGTEPANHVPPVHEYDRNGLGCSVTGGYVYRGDAIPDLQRALARNPGASAPGGIASRGGDSQHRSTCGFGRGAPVGLPGGAG
jgi:glucose/arabinose dehydrogenase